MDNRFKQILVDNVWIFEIIVGVALLIAANFALKFFVKRWRRHSLTSLHPWKSRVEKIVYVPIKCILWTVGVVYVLNAIAYRFGFQPHLTYLRPLCNSVIVICFGWILLRWKKEFQKQIQLVDIGIVQILSRLTTFAVVVLTLLLVLEIFSISIMPLIAFGGVGAAAIGFAAKDVLANFFGGLMLHVTRPFTMGDYILLPDRSIEGHVEMIGWYFTSIRDKEKRPVYLPNVFFSTLLVINSSRMSHRHILESIQIRYEDVKKTPAIVEDIKRILATHPSVDHNLPVIVSVDAFQNNAVSIKLDFYCLSMRTEAFHALKQEVLLAIDTIFTQHRAEVPSVLFFQN